MDGGAELVSGRVVESCEEGVSSLCLVKECQDLKMCEIQYCSRILDGVEKEMKEKIRKQDREGLLIKCRDKALLIARGGMAAIVEQGNGAQTVIYHRATGSSKIDEPPWEGKKPCPCCDLESLPCSVLDHVLAEHNVCTSSSDDDVIEQLKDLNLRLLADLETYLAIHPFMLRFNNFWCIMLHVGFAI